MTVDFNAALNAPMPQETGIEAVKLALAPYNIAISNMDAAAHGLMIEDDESNVMAVEMAGQVKRLWKKVEAIRKDEIEPHNKFVKAINALCKNYQNQFTEIEQILKGKISQYQARVELERRKAEEAARKAAEDLQAKLDAEAQAAGVESVTVDAPVIPEVKTVTHTAEGSAYQRTVWTHEIVDATRVPRKYLMVDEAEIKKAVKAGVRRIAGVRIFEKTTTVMRS